MAAYKFRVTFEEYEDISRVIDIKSSQTFLDFHKAQIQDFIDDPHQKIIYIYDFIEMWTMHIELIGIEMKENTSIKYPVCSKTIGLPPKQYDKVQRFGIVDDDEFEEITKNYLDSSDEIPSEISDDEADEFGLFDEEQGEASGEE